MTGFPPHHGPPHLTMDMRDARLRRRQSETDHVVRVGPIRSRVLLVEDDDEMRSLLSAVLGAEGYQVHEARDGREFDAYLARALLGRELVPDLIVSDIRMPGYTGLEVVESLRRFDWSIPVVMVTAFGTGETHAEARRLGVAATLDKPFDLDDLVRAARNLVPPTF